MKMAGKPLRNWILFFDVTENFPDSLKLRQITNEHARMWSSVLS